jgi:hypothetical protein
MNDRTNKLLRMLKPARSLWIGLTETLVLLPIPILVAAYLLPKSDGLLWMLLLPLIYWMGERSTVRMARIRMVYRLLFAGLYGYAAAWLMFDSVQGILIAGLIGAGFVYRGTAPLMPDDSNQLRELLLPGLILYFLVSAIGLRFDPIDEYRLLLTIGGGAAVLLTLVRSNRLALIDANYSGRSGRQVPKSVLARNRIMVGTFVAVLAFIASFRILEALWNDFRHWLQSVLSGLGGDRSEESPAQEMQSEAPQSPMLPEASNEPNAILKLLETILMYVVFVLLAVLAVYLLIQLIRRIPGVAKLAARWLATWRGRTRDEGSRGYEDEVESLAPLDSWTDRLTRRVTGWFGGESWTKLSEADRVRYLFRKRFREAAKKGFEYRKSMTPHENTEALNRSMPEQAKHNRELTTLYEEVRYGGRRVTNEEANQWKSKWGL